jgi:hypothetical protein
MYIFQEVFLGDHVPLDYKIQKLYCFNNNLEQWLYSIAHEKVNDDRNIENRQIITQVSEKIEIITKEYTITIDFRISPDSQQQKSYILKIVPYISIESNTLIPPNELLDTLLHIEKLFTLFCFNHIIHFYEVEFFVPETKRSIKYWNPKLYKFTQNEKITGLPLIKRGHLIDHLNPDREKINSIFSEWINLDSKELGYIINAIDVVTSVNSTHRSKLLEIIFMLELLAKSLYSINTSGSKNSKCTIQHDCSIDNYQCTEAKHILKCTLCQLVAQLPKEIIDQLNTTDLINYTKELRNAISHGKVETIFAQFSDINKTESILLFIKTLLIFLILQKIGVEHPFLINRFNENKFIFKSIRKEMATNEH